MHSGYSPRSFSNDIALLSLDRDVDYREDIAPVCLPLLSDVVEARSFVGTRPFVAGWGATRFQGPTSNTLQYAGLQVRSPRSCSSFNSLPLSTSFNSLPVAARSGLLHYCHLGIRK